MEGKDFRWPRPAPGPTLQQALIHARYPVVLRDSELSGAGAILLNNAIHPSRFVMLGEDHFTREIPRFAEARCDIIHPDAYAVEAGPYAGRFVNSFLSSPNRLKIMAERSRAFPNNMAFLDAREENDLAAHCAASSRSRDFAVWGLDQEFSFCKHAARGHILGRLAARSLAVTYYVITTGTLPQS